MTAVGGAQLLERESAFERLRRLTAEVADGGARLALVTGEAGIGKSSLQMVFTSQLGREWVVESVDGYRTDRAFAAPFGHLTGDLGDDDGSPAALIEAMNGRCRSLAEHGPLVVVIEDLHFLDPAAVRTMAPILDALADVPVLVVATSRPVAPDGDPAFSAALDSLRAHPAVVELALDPLSVGAVRELLGASATGADARSAAALHQRTGGNPFLVDAAIGAGAVGDGAEIPWTVSEAVGSLFEEVGDAAVAVAELLAIQGGPLPLDVVSALVVDAHHVVDVLERLGVVVVIGADLVPGSVEVRLRHALIADAVAASLDPVRRGLRHEELSTALLPYGSERAADLARHLAAAGDLAAAAPWAVIAADDLAVRGSHARAVEMYELALLSPPLEPRAIARLLERAAVMAARAGREDRAMAWGRAAYETRTADDKAWEAGRGWVNLLVLHALDEVMDGPSEIDADRSAELERIAELYAASQVAIEVRDHDEAVRLSYAVDDRAAAAGDDLGRLNGALSLILCGEVERASVAIDAVIAHAGANDDPGLESIAWSRRTRLHNVLGEPGVATRCHETAHELGRRAGGPDLWGNLVVMTAIMKGLVGDLDEAVGLCDETHGLELPMLDEVARVAHLAVAIERGDLVAADEQVTVLVPLVRAIGIPYYIIPVLMLSARARLLGGDLASAASMLDEAHALQVGAAYDFEHDVLVASLVLHHLRGDPVRRARVAERIDHLSAQFRGPQLAAASSFAAGLRALDDGDRAAASEMFRAAAEAWEAAPRWGFAADAWCAAAEASTGAASRRALASASAIAAAKGMPRVAWRVALLSDPGAPGSVLSLLTPQEAAVVTEAAAGRTNREIADLLGLKERTVRNYLSAAFAKLGIERRTQLAAVVRGSR